MKLRSFKRPVAIILALVFMMTQCIVFAEGTVPKRDEIKAEYKWRLDHIYKSIDLWEKDYTKVQKEFIPKIKTYKGKLANTTKILEFFKLSEQMNRTLDKLNVYAYMSMDQNAADSKASELASKVDSLIADAAAAESFSEPELLSQPEKTIKGYINNPKFKTYKYYFEMLLKKKAHTLSKAEEELLAMASDLAGEPSKINSKAVTADIEFPMTKGENGTEVELSEGSYNSLRENQDREVRKEAFEKLYTTYGKMKNTLAETLNAEVKKNIFFSKARKYNSSLEASMAESDIPTSVYENLVKAVNNNVGSLHKYIELRRKVLGIDKVHFYDMYVPLVKDYQMTVKYEDAKKKILEGLKPLGKEYVDEVNKAFGSGWIDVYETENKYTGAYSWGCYDSHPYMLLNYNDTADAMVTAAHEMGHSMHTFYSNKNQEYVNSDYKTFVAEVASTTNEFLMLDYLLKNAKSNDEKLFLLSYLIEDIRGSIYTQIMYAEFEKAIHDRVESGEALSTDTLRSMWKALMVKYFGESFEVDEWADLWWTRIDHFFMNFYVYQYSTGMAAAYPLSNSLLKGEKGAADKYMTFLKSGASDSSINLLKNAGVDMTSTKPVDDILKYFDKLVNEMEKTLKEEGKIK